MGWFPVKVEGCLRSVDGLFDILVSLSRSHTLPWISIDIPVVFHWVGRSPVRVLFRRKAALRRAAEAAPPLEIDLYFVLAQSNLVL